MIIVKHAQDMEANGGSNSAVAKQAEQQVFETKLMFAYFNIYIYSS